MEEGIRKQEASLDEFMQELRRPTRTSSDSIGLPRKAEHTISND